MIVKDIFKKASTGTTCSEISDYVSEKYGTNIYPWSSAVIRNILRNPNYIGKIKYSGELYDGIHEPIISETEFNNVQEIINRRREIFYKKRSTEERKTHLLTSLLFCGDCGARMGYIRTTPNIDRYACYSVSKKHKGMIKSDHCSNRLNLFSASELEEIILGEISKLSLDPSIIETDIVEDSTPENNTADIMNRLDDVDKQISRLLDLYQIGLTDIDEVSVKLENLRDEREKLDVLLEESKMSTTITKDHVRKTLSNLEDIIENGSRSDLSDIIHTLIDKIVVLNDDIKIYWSFC